MATTKEKIKEQYKKQGLEVEHGFDKAGKVYRPHRHERTLLYTLDGSLSIKIENQSWRILNPGDECVIGNNQLHEAKVGPEGWEYIAAWNKEESKKFKPQH